MWNSVDGVCNYYSCALKPEIEKIGTSYKNGDPKMHNGNVARKKTSFKIKFYIEIQISHQAVANRKMGSKILNLVPHVGIVQYV